MGKESKKEAPKIKITENGPYLVSGGIPLSKEVIVTDNEGTPEKWKETKKFDSQENYALCRCGKSKNKPFCDGTHVSAKFNGQETADVNEKYADNAEIISGHDLILQDNAKLCIGAGFCHRGEGTWDLTEKSNIPECRKLAIEEACNCPSGRLVVLDKKTKKPIETLFKPSISLTEHPNNTVSGPLWVKGNISIESSSGKQYEKRNRVTLCRCGKSGNKPFCDGTHIDINFKDNK
jgi:CDGSH-type Zn-finger protein